MRKFYVEKVTMHSPNDEGYVDKQVLTEDEIINLIEEVWIILGKNKIPPNRLEFKHHFNRVQDDNPITFWYESGWNYDDYDPYDYIDSIGFNIYTQKGMLNLRSEKMQEIHKEYSHLQLKFDELVENLDV